MPRLLWLTSEKGYSEAVKPVVMRAIRAAKIDVSDVHFASLHHKAYGLLRYRTKTIQVLDEAAAVKARAALDELIAAFNPKLIVINDLAALFLIAGEGYSLNLCRGSIYYYKGVPCMPVDAIYNLFNVNEARWVFANDMQKAYRWINGTQREEPKFTYTVCRTLDQVREALDFAKSACALSIDSETRGGIITCIGYTGLVGTRLHTYVIPFFDPTRSDGCFWPTEREECEVWQAVKEIHASSAIKILQNGSYDMAWFIAYRVPCSNYLVDTSNLIHSIWMESPKKLNFIASLMLDFCRYWKDESKGSKEDDWSTTGAEQYWRYNALDCYNTFLAALPLLKLMLSQKWALANYNTEFALGSGPCLAMSLRGVRRDQHRHASLMASRAEDADKALARLRLMVDDPEFNPESSDQVAHIFYDILGAAKTRLQRKGGKYGPRSTDKKVLERIADQPNPLFKIYLDAVVAAKEPRADISKYGDEWKMFKKGRFYSWLSAAGTDTGRFSCGSSQFWVGTNAQNIPPDMREFLVADPDYVLVEIDYSASDDVFIAYEAQDPVKIELVTSDKDAHCFHAAVFFKRTYEEVLKGKKESAEWCVHPTKGVRSNTKRVVHGKNFRMQEGTLYNTMGKAAVVASAHALGFSNPGAMTEKELIGVCKVLGDTYDHPTHGLYKRIRPWQDETVDEAIKNGNLVTCSGGRTRLFFADLANDHAAQRQISAFYGQGGTAANVNRSLNSIFYGDSDRPNIPPIDDGKTWITVLQTHDSLTALVHKDHLYKAWDVVEVMERKQVIHGREMFVKAKPTIGITWSKEDMMPMTRTTTYEDVLAYEKKTFSGKFRAAFDAERLAEMII